MICQLELELSKFVVVFVVTRSRLLSRSLSELISNNKLGVASKKVDCIGSRSESDRGKVKVNEEPISS